MSGDRECPYHDLHRRDSFPDGSLRHLVSQGRLPCGEARSPWSGGASADQVVLGEPGAGNGVRLR